MKYHILVDTLGLLLNVVVHRADIQDRDGAALVLDKRNCSRGWRGWCSGDGERAVDEGADGIPGGLALQAGGPGDGSIAGVVARPPG